MLEWPEKNKVLSIVSEPIQEEMCTIQYLGNQQGNLINYYYICDNIDGLRYLEQKTKNKYNLIYLDPPYNTSRIRLRSHFTEINGSTNKDDLKITDSRETIIDAHVRWLNTIYPRLLLAQRLLTDDGVIILSIDDTEFASLRILCDEVFGAENFIECIVWERETITEYQETQLFHNHDYNLIYSNNSQLLFDSLQHPTYPHPSLWRCDKAGSSVAAKEQLAKLMGGKVYFEYPKPQMLLQSLFQLYSDKNAHILDFYAGSASTAEAVLELNKADNGNRTFTLMQDDVPLYGGDGDSDISSVPQLGIERINRLLAHLGMVDTQVMVKQLIEH